MKIGSFAIKRITFSCYKYFCSIAVVSRYYWSLAWNVVYCLVNGSRLNRYFRFERHCCALDRRIYYNQDFRVKTNDSENRDSSFQVYRIIKSSAITNTCDAMSRMLLNATREMSLLKILILLIFPLVRFMYYRAIKVDSDRLATLGKAELSEVRMISLSLQYDFRSVMWMSEVSFKSIQIPCLGLTAVSGLYISRAPNLRADHWSA